MHPLANVVPGRAHSTTMLLVHLVWATRRRAALLEPRLDAWLADLLERKARRLDCLLLATGSAADHVHVLIRHPPSVPVSQIAHRLKGSSSRLLGTAITTGEQNLWQVGYWAESVGPHDLEPLVTYIRDQRSRHRQLHDLESWEHSLR